MKSVEYLEQYINLNKKITKAVLFGAATAGVAAGAYIGARKIIDIIEDKRLARYYEDEIENIFQEKERMKFYEDEFIRQEEAEKEELQQAVNEFNSRRLRRDECPNCSDEKRRVKNKRRQKNTFYESMDEPRG